MTYRTLFARLPWSLVRESASSRLYRCGPVWLLVYPDTRRAALYRQRGARVHHLATLRAE